MASSSLRLLPEQSERFPILPFVLFHAVAKMLLLGWNQGVYTDGILQITQFDRPDSFWPPLYTALILPFRALGLDGVLAGRLISLLASVALIPFLYTVARHWQGRRAAFYTLLLYSVAALPWRWSLRVMTDMPFLLCFWIAWGHLLLEGLEPDDKKRRNRLLWATLFAVLAGLTRYQGLLFLPWLLWRGGCLLRRGNAGQGGITLAAQLGWLSLPAWNFFQRFGHGSQVVERAGPDLAATLLNAWNLAEMFLYILPYALTLPVFAFALYGGMPGTRPLLVPLRRAFLFSAFLIISAQAFFQSFQTRYLLPLFPFLLCFAGAGMSRLEAATLRHGPFVSRARRILAGMALAGCVLWSALFAGASLYFQRGAFGDIFAAGRYIRSLELDASVPVFSNESYKPGMEGIKLAYGAGRPVKLLPELRQNAQPMPPGALVVLHSCYGGLAQQKALVERLQQSYRLQPLPEGTFSARLIPLLPDIMQEPGTHQNPLAWGLRYQPQYFRTLLFLVKGYRNATPQPW